MSASIKILFRKDKINKKGEVPLYLRIIKFRNSKLISLGIAIPEKYWDAENKRVRKGMENSQRINNYIAHKIAEAEGVALTMEATSKTIMPKNIKSAILGDAPTSFLKYAEDYADMMEPKIKPSTVDKIRGVTAKIKKYTNENDLMFGDIDLQWIKKYETYLRVDLKNINNTVFSNFKVLRRIFNEAIKDEIVAFDKNPFTKFKFKWETTKIEFLTETELENLEKLKLEHNPIQFNVRNIYAFACYAGGIRISDILQLRWSNYDGVRILVNTQKTGSTVSVKLPQIAIDIINLYYYDGLNQSDFIFPFLENDKDYSNERFVYTSIAACNTMCNRELKNVIELAGIKKHAHFHTSRHTFAVRALKKGMRIEYLSKLMGHATIKTTQIYAKVVNEDLDNAMDVFNKKSSDSEQTKLLQNIAI